MTLSSVENATGISDNALPLPIFDGILNMFTFPPCGFCSIFRGGIMRRLPIIMEYLYFFFVFGLFCYPMFFLRGG